MKKGELIELLKDMYIPLDSCGFNQVKYLGMSTEFLNFELYRQRSGTCTMSVPIGKIENDINFNGFKSKIARIIK